MGGYEIQVDNANCVNQLRAEGGGEGLPMIVLTSYWIKILTLGCQTSKLIPPPWYKERGSSSGKVPPSVFA